MSTLLGDIARRRWMTSLDQILIPTVFRSQADLARAVLGIESSAYTSQRALSSFLSQIVGGSRPCPPNLARLIIEATKAQHGITEKTLSDLKQALGQADDDDISQLLQRQLKAEEVVIIRREPLDLQRHPRLDEFQNCMWDALVGPDCKKVTQPTSKYRFVMDRPEVAKQHWTHLAKGLSTYLVKNACDTMYEPTSVLISLNGQGEGALQISHASADKCVLPLVAFDPERMGKGYLDVFFWESFVKEGEPADHIVRFDYELKNEWFEFIYTASLKEQHLTHFPYNP